MNVWYCSGHIGISAFHRILTDTRIQGIPLILETPSFENPEVWATEIEALNKLSTLSEENAQDIGKDLVVKIRDVVKRAAGSDGEGKRSSKCESSSKSGKKRGSKKEG
jgi:AP endonuclease-1